MDTARSTSRARRSRQAVIGLAVVVGSGCSFAVADADPPVAPVAAPHLVYRVSERSPESRSVQLLPQELDRMATFGRALDARLYMGGIAWFTDRSAGYRADRLALVILAVNDSIRPVLRDFRQLLLDVDGQMFRTHPAPDPRLYNFESTDLGHTETIIVPIDRRLLQLMVEADRVRGRVGHWLSFDIPDEVRGRLGELLTALPGDSAGSRRRIVSSPLQRATY